MDNSSFSKVLADVAVLMQARGDNVFKVRAHSKASDTIKSLSYPIANIAHDAEKLGELTGFGAGIIQVVQEIGNTGKLGLLDELLEELPDGVLELVQIPGIGPKTAVTAANELGISSYGDLASSIEAGEFQRLPRISKKGAVQILRHANMRIVQGSRIGLGSANDASQRVISELKNRCGEVGKIEAAGSLRRAAELVGDINLVCESESPEIASKIIDAFTTLSNVNEVLEFDDSRAIFVNLEGLRFSIQIVEPDAYASALVYATGSIDHGDSLVEIADELGLSLTPKGLFDAGDQSLVPMSTESDVYQRLGLSFVPPEMRENKSEMERAKSGDFDWIVSLDDIRGDLHIHTNWSDGRFSMEEMVEAATERGLEYIAVTDHSPSATVANGLDPDMLLAHNDAVKDLAESSNLRLLTGTEMDIKPDGSLDYSDELLADLDIVIASIHSGMDQDSATMTQRVIDAMESPHVDVICHLTARLLGKRAPVEIDVEAVFEAAVRTGTVLEINASPDRLDLRADHVRRANELGVLFAINTDSHRTWQFDNMRYGVSTAVRGWVEADRVINTFQYAELKAFLALPKSQRYAFNE
ncbi:MAG TPA: DNA polymerase/3'-5' exonuclease PolX [Dehalococcoidia bacterium]|nr:DNA polymerase/3'-5' exonuclease PolX [Chloroflexota bacterium]HCI86618.1 DNA polymerase/3'-5' exonuclease PolX [Dehalococcoidia bacterium]|tara:strand:- start:4670 stop:6427 length:1758 start_codon:yes stop_codon:yes gene_type:complete